MALKPTQARVRAYNVGFGDCFLLSFDYPNGSSRHVLIDFGTTERGRKSPEKITDVAKQIAADCGGKLHMVVASHRHADHISGFAGSSGKVIKTLNPDVVLQPWTERPDLAPDANAPAAAPARGDDNKGARAAVARLADLHLIAQLALAQVGRLAGSGARKSALAQLEFLGNENLKNSEAVHALARLGSRQIYAHFGMRLNLGKVLPGVKVDVIGPPTVEQYAAIKNQVPTHATEFWHLAASTSRAQTPAGAPLFPTEPVTTEIPQEARWVIPQIDRMNAEELLSLVRMLDSAMNNTSLILLFDVAGTVMLFPGDAQLENWSYALRDAPNAAKIRSRLANTQLYKVGHHGSLNATPKSMLWQGFARRTTDATDPNRLVTLLSTKDPSKHGDDARGTEVPRKKLLEELKLSSTLHNTNDIPTSKDFFLDVTIPL